MAYVAQPKSFLADVTRRIRNYLQAPSESAKWTDDLLWPMIVDAWTRIMYDVTSVAENPLQIRYEFTTDGVNQRYLLPGNMGTFMRLGTIDGDWVRRDLGGPRGRLNPWGAGFLLEGPWIRFEPDVGTVTTFAVDYLPSGECPLHYSTSSANSFVMDAATDTTTFALDPEPEEGYYDSRPNAYLGALVRFLGDEEDLVPDGYNVFPVQERVIIGCHPEDNTVTVAPALDFDPQGSLSNVQYEVLPMFGLTYRDAIAWSVVALLRNAARDFAGETAALRRYSLHMRQIRLQAAHANGRNGSRFVGDVPGTGRFSWWYGSGM